MNVFLDLPPHMVQSLMREWFDAISIGQLDVISLENLFQNDNRCRLTTNDAFNFLRLEISLIPAAIILIEPFNLISDALNLYGDMVERYLGEEGDTILGIASNVELSDVLIQSEYDVLTALKAQKPPRFEFRTLRGSRELCVFVISSTNLTYIKDYGNTPDTTPSLPKPINSWETPTEMRSVDIINRHQKKQWAPLELKNKDYLCRIFDITSEGISESVATILNQRPSFDIYYILQDILKEPNEFMNSLSLHQQQYDHFLVSVTTLLKARNMQMYINFFDVNNAASSINLKELFKTALRVVGEFVKLPEAKQARNALKTLVHLRMQYVWHTQWNELRFNNNCLTIVTKRMVYLDFKDISDDSYDTTEASDNDA